MPGIPPSPVSPPPAPEVTRAAVAAAVLLLPLQDAAVYRNACTNDSHCAFEQASLLGLQLRNTSVEGAAAAGDTSDQRQCTFGACEKFNHHQHSLLVGIVH